MLRWRLSQSSSSAARAPIASDQGQLDSRACSRGSVVRTCSWSRWRCAPCGGCLALEGSQHELVVRFRLLPFVHGRQAGFIRHRIEIGAQLVRPPTQATGRLSPEAGHDDVHSTGIEYDAVSGCRRRNSPAPLSCSARPPVQQTSSVGCRPRCRTRHVRPPSWRICSSAGRPRPSPSARWCTRNRLVWRVTS